MNIFGGLCFIINSYHQHDNPSIVTNAVWASIGLFAIFYNRNR